MPAVLLDGPGDRAGRGGGVARLWRLARENSHHWPTARGHMKFGAVILAGGRSQRMGQDKAWLMLDGKPLIARQVELARELGAAEVFIAGRVGTDYDSLNCRVVHDRVMNAGPLAGI